MLADAYTKAEKGDFSTLHELMSVFASPYDEQDASVAAKYYRSTPATMQSKVTRLAHFPLY